MSRNSILTVLIQADSYDLTILSTLKTELNITTTDNDDYFRELIHRASGDINDWCKRIFAKETVSEMWRGWGIHSPLVLRRLPITSITSIVIDDEDPIDSDLYEMNRENGMVWGLDDDNYRTFWPWDCGKKITIVYVGGYTLLDELPYGIEEACLELIKHRWLNIRREVDLKSVEIPGVIAKTFDTNLSYSYAFPEKVKDLLSKYRRIVIG